MAFNNTEQERQRRLRVDLAKKIRLEAILAREVGVLFNRIARTARNRYEENQSVIDASVFDVELNATLRKHYRRVQQAFKTTLRSEMEKAYMGQILYTKAVDPSVALENQLTQYVDERSDDQTNIISDTNQEELDNSFNESFLTLNQNQVNPTNTSIALLASQTFRRRALSRANTIGLTETQITAEDTKSTEADVLIGAGIVVAGVVLNQSNVSKVWSTVLDNRTRPSHAQADDQRVAQDNAFRVQGQSLMFPGDTSLGASLDNVINCRCNSTRAIDLSGVPDATQPRGRPPTRGQLQANEIR